MFLRLRNRFLLLLMATVTFLLLMFYAVLLAFLYTSSDMRTQQTLDRGFNYQELLASSNSDAPSSDQTFNFAPLITIDISEQGEIGAINSSFPMNREFYEALLVNAKLRNRTYGSVIYKGNVWRFKVFDIVKGKRYVFLDISREFQILNNMFYIFLWIALPMLTAIFFICKYFADRSIRPIEQSYHKQNVFLADVSHEIKTPLATILTNISVLQSSANPDQARWIGYISDEALRMKRLINQLLYITRAENDAPVMTKCNLSEIVNKTLMPLQAVFYEKKITCELTVADGVFVMGDQEQLQRLVGIFTDNAIKYCGNSVKIDLHREQRNAWLSIQNDGDGIAPEDLPKIWDRFYRSDKSREHKGGFGLGLSMAKVIIDDIGGTAKVQSTDGKTTFTVCIPAVNP